MSQQLKFIIEKLNAVPFRRNFNLISFDALEPFGLLQVLNDVLAEIGSQNKVDLREEAPEQTAIRMLNFLRILGYKPNVEAGGNIASFRNGLVQAEKQIVYPLLHWLLQRLSELKKRAYLAKFLVRIEVPAEHLHDEQVAEVYQGYEDLMAQFKELHKTAGQLKSSGFSTAEIRKDIGNMEDEREQLQKRVERLQRRVQSIPDYEQLLSACQELRMEREKEGHIAEMKRQQKNQVLHMDQKLYRTGQQLRDLKATLMGATAEGLLRQLEEENKVNSYMCNEKLPKEVDSLKMKCSDMEQVLSMPALSESDLDELQDQIDEANEEINALVEKRMLRANPADDKLAIVRQQASMIQRKKEMAMENLKEAMEELASLDVDLKEKREALKEMGGAVPSAEEMKTYVSTLRVKGIEYKRKRAELAEIRDEVSVLSRTEEILRSKDDSVGDYLSKLEEEKGISGYQKTQEELEKVSTMKSELDERKGKTLEGISEMAKRLHETIMQKRTKLAPIIRELRPLRQEHQDLVAEHEEKKAVYDTTLAGLESNLSKLEQEVKAYREEILLEQSRYHYLMAMKKVTEEKQRRVAAEMKSYVSTADAERKKSYRDLYTKKIQEQENQGKALREKQKAVRESHGPSMRQMKMWKDLEKLMQCKRECFAKQQEERRQEALAEQDIIEDRLVL
ncbi:intraflagellar transport protein 81 homolog [Oscarella lobularis]|uniref:intraflagellar transport protein 81 homolog n=1 Tax=Oscarella lobularis TaxID=121494 RepID=UPI0033132282